jgi:hypothetical protein
MLEQERAFKGEDVVRFLKHLMGQIPGKLLVIYLGRLDHPSWPSGQRLPLKRSGFWAAA